MSQSWHSMQGSDEVASGTWWPRAGIGRAHDHQHQEIKHGWSSPSCARGSPSSAGLNVTLQNTFTATAGTEDGTCPVPSTGQGVPGSGIIPRMGSVQDVQALAGLLRLCVSPQFPHQSRDKEKLVGKRCEEEEEGRKSSNTEQVSGEPKLCCFLLIMKYS